MAPENTTIKDNAEGEEVTHAEGQVAEADAGYDRSYCSSTGTPCSKHAHLVLTKSRHSFYF